MYCKFESDYKANASSYRNKPQVSKLCIESEKNQDNLIVNIE